MIGSRRIVVVVPALNEEELIGRVVATMPSFVDRVIVVDDGSSDLTAEVALREGDARVRVVRHPRRRGVGAAIVTGYRAALAETSHGRDAIAVMAGDGQMDPGDLRDVVLPITSGAADYVKGERFSSAGVARAMGLPRWIGGQVFTRLTSLAIGRSIEDSQCGYTAIARGAVLAIDVERLWPSFGYPNDLLGLLASRDLVIEEVPVRPIYGSERSKLRLRHLPAIFFLIGRAALRRTRRHPNGRHAGIGVTAEPYHPERTECEPHGPPRVPPPNPGAASGL